MWKELLNDPLVAIIAAGTSIVLGMMLWEFIKFIGFIISGGKEKPKK